MKSKHISNVNIVENGDNTYMMLNECKHIVGIENFLNHDYINIGTFSGPKIEIDATEWNKFYALMTKTNELINSLKP